MGSLYNMDRFLFAISFIIYGVSSVGFFINMLTMRKDAKEWALRAIIAATFFHGASIILRAVKGGYAPFVGLEETLSFMAFCLACLYVFLELRYELKSIGCFVCPIILIAMTGAYIVPSSVSPLPPALQSLWLPVHASICLMSYAVFALAFSISLMYILQERQIKTKRLGGLFKRLPSLDALDAINERCLKIGFPLLTVGIITGSIWAEEAWGRYWGWDPKETWSLITWLWYAAILHQRLTVGWRGRRAAIMTIIGFLTLIFTFLGVNFLLHGEHSYASTIG